MYHTWMVWVKQSSLSLSASLFCRLHRRAFCKKTLQPSTSWIRFRLTSLKGKSMGKHDPSNVLTSNATSSWEIWVSSQNFVRIFILVDGKKQWKRLKFETNILQATYQNDPFQKKHTIKKNIHKLSTCYQIYFTLQQTIFRHFLCIHCFFHCYFWVSNSFGDGGQCQLQMSWPRCEVLEEESLIESIGGFLEDSERANTKSTGEGLGKHDMFFFDMVVSTK